MNELIDGLKFVFFIYFAFGLLIGIIMLVLLPGGWDTQINLWTFAKNVLLWPVLAFRKELL